LYETDAGIELEPPWGVSVNVELVIDVGSIVVEKVAVGCTVDATPVAPAVGVTA
jgi:hypothetical protein